ncbi:MULTISPECIES: WXG100 family type VII secretion target [unclassified Nonomuraea]|uniref:WXG100 family type VII secretion target n=1 Tax=unclassified Nonomuraea TaxID=2593643 RepID=UPI0034085F12
MSGVGDLPGGDRLAALLAKVTGNPQAIRSTANAWRTAAGHVARSTNSLTKSVGEVDKAWQGGSADAFTKHMAAYPRASTGLNDALSACADALDKAATSLEDAHGKVNALCQDAVQRAAEYKTQYAKLNPKATAQDAEDALAKTTIVSGNVTKAEALVEKAEGDLEDAKKALAKQLGADGEFGFFTKVPQPDGADFEPGDRKVEWVRTPFEDKRTSLESAAAAGGSDGGGASGGAGYAYSGGVSSAGNTPAPKAEVVDWIKEALRVIKSPEMADELRKRGLLDKLQDLDPNDPKAIERIWTIIYHESGGNPSAINNWDINAKNGVPSQGLMQTIPPTFDHNSLPGYKQILEPVDNIIAGVLYTYDRYGSLANHPGIESMEQGGPYRPY